MPHRILHVSVLLVFWLTVAICEDAAIDIHADQVLKSISPLLSGICIEDVNHEIYGGLYSQMIFGESFQEPPSSPPIMGFNAVGGAWKAQGGELSINGSD